MAVFRRHLAVLCPSRVYLALLLLQREQLPTLNISKPFSRAFPYDVLCAIVYWVSLDSRRDLETLSVVNRQFFTITCGIIWANVELAVEPMESARANNEKLNVLLRRASQGIGLKRLAIRLQAELPEGPHLTGFRTRLQLLAQEAFQVQFLTLVDTSKSMNLNGLVVADFAHHRFRLVELYCKLAPTPKLHDFIISQPTIRRLSLVPITATLDHALGEDLPADALPDLEAALGDIQSLQILRKGRAVRYISVVPAVQSEQLPELWNTLSVPSSQCPLESLSIIIDRSDTFRAFLFRLHTYVPTLRFLDITILCEYTVLWREPGPAENDTIPLRNLTKLETIRWDFLPIDGSREVIDPNRTVEVRRWRPERYAGPSLRYVQHELGFRCPDSVMHEHEGRWERRSPERNDDWLCSEKVLFPPRREGKLSNRESMDPIGLEYLSPVPHVPEFGSLVVT
ncbi:hypothetical protein DL93DRAFT_2209975 [Clavulina sp. PMI_390]|nr:hypothetical protein DL93DRAFT_2209975 [Clavulina sp. PMI_390]